MGAIHGLIHYHPAISAVVGYWVMSAGISSLPAPTVKSHMFYLWFFKFANTLGANLARAYSSAVENSPNFQAAVNLIGNGGTKS